MIGNTVRIEGAVTGDSYGEYNVRGTDEDVERSVSSLLTLTEAMGREPFRVIMVETKELVSQVVEPIFIKEAI